MITTSDFWLAATWPLLFQDLIILTALREPKSVAASAIISSHLQKKTTPQFFTSCDSHIIILVHRVSFEPSQGTCLVGMFSGLKG